MSTVPTGPTPNTSAERLVHLDILRGFTLLGVLLSNIQYWFRAPRGHQNLSYTAWPGFANDAASWLIRTLFETKSIFLLSMLFAVGLAIQSERTEARGARFGGLGIRRLLALVLFGLLHVVLVWNGDILLEYGLLGFVLLPFLKRQPRTLWRWVIGFWGLILFLMLVGPLKTLLGAQPAWMTPAAVARNDAGELRFITYLARHYQATSWLEVTRFRILDFGRILADSIPSYIVLFGNMLVGLAAWKSGLLRDPRPHLAALRRFTRWALPLGIGLHIVYGFKFALRFWGYTQPWSVGRFIPLVVDMAMLFGAIAFCLGLGAGFLVLTQDERWRRRLAPLGTLGRMTLSTYLTQSVVMTFIFYGWGLGYYNRMSPLAGLLLGLGVFALQVPLSAWWLARFRFGPVEWLWRCITYARILPFRI